MIKQLAPSLNTLTPSLPPDTNNTQSSDITRQVVTARTTRLTTNASMLWLTGCGSISQSQSQGDEGENNILRRDSQEMPEKVYGDLDLSSS